MIFLPFILYIARISVSLAQTSGNSKLLSVDRNSPAQILSLHPAIDVVEKLAESSSHKTQQNGDNANQLLRNAFQSNTNVFSTTHAPKLSEIENSQNPLSAPSVKRTRTRNVFKEPTNLQDFFKSGRLETFLPPGLDFLSAKELSENVKQLEQSKDGKGIFSEQAQQKDSSRRWKSMVTAIERQVGDPVALVLEKKNSASSTKDKTPKTDLLTPYDKDPFINFDFTGGGLQQIKYIPNNGIPFLDQFVHSGLMHNGISDSKTLPSNTGQSGPDLPWIEQDPWDITFRTKQVDSGTPLPWLDPNESKGLGKNVNTENSINYTNADSLQQIDTAIESTSKQTGSNTLNSLNTGWAGWVEPSPVNDAQRNIKDSWINSSLQNKLLPIQSSVNSINSSSESQGQSISSITSNTKSKLPTEIVKTIAVSNTSPSGSDNKNNNNFFATWDPWRTDIVSNPEGVILNNPTVFERRKGFIGDSVASSNAQVDIVSPPLLDNSILMKQQEERANREMIENNSGLNMPSLIEDIISTVNNQVQSSSPIIPDNTNPIEQAVSLIDNTYNPSLVDNTGIEIQNTKEQIIKTKNNHIEVPLGVSTSPLMDNFNPHQRNGEIIDKKIDNNSVIDNFVNALRENAFPVEPSTGMLDKTLLDINPVKDTVTEPLQIVYHENPFPNGQTGNVQTDHVSSPLINNFGTNSNIDRPPTDVASTSTIQNNLNTDISKVKVQAAIKDNKMTNIVGPTLPTSFQTVSSVNPTSPLIRQPLLDNNPKDNIENFIEIKAHGLNNPGAQIPGKRLIETSLPNENHLLTAIGTTDQNTFNQKELNHSMQNQVDPMSNTSFSDPTTKNAPTDLKPKVNSIEPNPSKDVLSQQNKEMKPQVSIDSKYNVNIGPKSLLPDTSKLTSTKSLEVIKPIMLDKSMFDINQSANQTPSKTEQPQEQTDSKSIKAKEIDLPVSLQKLKLLARFDGGIEKPSSIVNALKDSAPINEQNSKSQLRSLQFDSINKNTNKPVGYLTTHNSIFFDPKTNKAVDPFRQVTREVLENAKKAWTNALADVGSSQVRVGFLPSKTTEFAGTAGSNIISPNRNRVQNNGQNLNFNSGDISLIDPITEGEVLRLNLPHATPRQRRFPLRQNIDPTLATAPDSMFLGPFLYGPVDHSSGDNIELSGTLLVPVQDHASPVGNKHHRPIFIPNNNNKQTTVIHGHHRLMPQTFAGKNINNNERPQQSPVPNVNSRDRVSELSRLKLLSHHTNHALKHNFPAALLKSFKQGQIDSRINANILSARKTDLSHKIREVTPQMLKLQANRRLRNPFTSSTITRRIPSRRPIQTSNILGQNRFLSANTGNRIRNRERNFVSRNQIIRPQVKNPQIRQDIQSNNWIRSIVEVIQGISRRIEGNPSSSVLNRQFNRRGHRFNMRNLLRNISVQNVNSEGRSLRNIVPTRTTLSVSPRVKTRPLSTITNPVSRIAIPSHRRLIHKPSGRFWDFPSHSRTFSSLSGVPLRSDFVHLKPSSWLNNPTVPINQPPVIS